jgi:DNA-directed RNA polymerase subunit RPC12/RpoP
MRLSFTCTRCLTVFAAFRNGLATTVAKCPGCGALCADPSDRDAGMRVRREERAIILEPVRSVPSARYRCSDCAGEFTERAGGQVPVVCPACASGRCEQVSPGASGMGFGSSTPLTRAQRKRQRFVTRWHGNYETLRKHAEGLLEAMGPLELDEATRDEAKAFVNRLVTAAEEVKEAKIARYLERLSGHAV